MNPSNPIFMRCHHRHATVLVLVVMMLIGLLAVAGMVIDLGIARLTQVQMQGAADFAAIESLRNRDSEPAELAAIPINTEFLAQVELVFGGPRPAKPATPFDPNDPSWITWYQWLDAARRVAANRAVGIAFANSPDEFGGEVQRGAGPVISLDNPLLLDGVDFVAAGTIVTPPDGHAYRPDLLNDPSGLGFVPGAFGLNADYALNHPDDARDEAIDYERRDFVTVDANETPRASSVLVRLRRTVDNPDPEGGALPLLFSPFSLRPTQQPNAGVPVRSSSIASAGDATFENTDPSSPKNYSVGLAKTVGPAVIDPDTNQFLLPGVAPFGLRLTQWNAFVHLNLSQSTSTHMDLTVVGNSLQDPASGNEEWGRVRQDSGQPEVIGNVFQSDSGSQPLQDAQASNEFHVYVPVYDDSLAVGPELRIVGFVFLSWDYSSAPTLRLHAIQDQIVSSNGTRIARGKIGNGNLCSTLAFDLQTDKVAELFALHNDRVVFPSPLVAPVLVNRTIGPQL